MDDTPGCDPLKDKVGQGMDVGVRRRVGGEGRSDVGSGEGGLGAVPRLTHRREGQRGSHVTGPNTCLK